MLTLARLRATGARLLRRAADRLDPQPPRQVYKLAAIVDEMARYRAACAARAANETPAPEKPAPKPIEAAAAERAPVPAWARAAIEQLRTIPYDDPRRPFLEDFLEGAGIDIEAELELGGETRRVRRELAKMNPTRPKC